MTGRVEIRLPQFGMGMQAATIIHWYKAEGEAVEEGEALTEVEAPKATEEIPAPCSGVVDRILVAVGETVPVNELLALIAPAG